ncbi:MAG TPA: UTP--glucose-1-phosphate uridylyltransferase, partial [Caulobacteraceae bacterium]|nr:UTP--glucose-1-phosphate uridylyltransferase [Caulobacteraceae bacterium]
MSPVRKAVIPLAGLGTRIQPAAKTTPKNMLNVFDRPLLAHIVAEGRAAGIEHFVFVVGRGQGSIEDYFDHAYELEAELQKKGKAEILAAVREDVLPAGAISIVRQLSPEGLGHAVACAADIVGQETFAVMLPDMLMDAQRPALAQAIAAHQAVGGNIVVVEPAPEGEAHKYGIVALGAAADGFDGRLAPMTGMVEKPAPGTEPSNLFISGRYILEGAIFGALAATAPGAGGEIQLTDAMLTLMKTRPFHALAYEGTTYDCGDPVGLLRANLAFALKHPTLAPAARAAAEALLT